MTMDSVQHCQNQAAECLRLMNLAPNEAKAEVLKNLAQSWSRLAGQIDRYQALMREQRCIIQNKAASGWRRHFRTVRLCSRTSAAYRSIWPESLDQLEEIFLRISA
jgi:hypothetical protein